MDTLTRGERWVRCLTGQPIDHVPFGNGIGWYTWGETEAKWKEEQGVTELPYARQLKFEDPHCAYPALDYLFCPAFEREILSEDETTSTVREPNGVVQAIEAADPGAARFLLGVQWHPEYLPQVPVQQQMFRALVAAAKPGSRAKGPAAV